MKRKMIGLFLGSMILSGTICSCGVDVPSESNIDNVVITTDSSEAFLSTEATEEITTDHRQKHNQSSTLLKPLNLHIYVHENYLIQLHVDSLMRDLPLIILILTLSKKRKK